MAEAYSVELRDRVVRAYEAGEGTHAEIAERFALGEATVKRWVWLQRKKGDVSPMRKGGGTPSEISATRSQPCSRGSGMRRRTNSQLTSTGLGAERLGFTSRA